MILWLYRYKNKCLNISISGVCHTGEYPCRHQCDFVVAYPSAVGGMSCTRRPECGDDPSMARNRWNKRMSAWHTATRDSHFSVRSKPWCLLSSAYTAWLYRPLYISVHVAACWSWTKECWHHPHRQQNSWRHGTHLACVYSNHKSYISMYICFRCSRNRDLSQSVESINL